MSENYSLKYQEMSLEVAAMGAELQSLKLNDTELLWQGSENFWKGRAPILFPIVGPLKDNKYSYKGRSYEMPTHGFARTSVFELEDCQDDSLTLLLKSNDTIMKNYPFHFEFRVKYSLKGTCLTQMYSVTNKSDDEMPFSLGIHTALQCPASGLGEFTDYSIKFDHTVLLKRELRKDGGLLSGEQAPLLSDSHLKLDYSLFKPGAIIILGIKEKHLTLQDKNDRYKAEYHFEDYADLGIWTMDNAPFLCIEPWNGYNSCVNGDYDILKKPGIMMLAPGKSRQFTNSIKFSLER